MPDRTTNLGGLNRDRAYGRGMGPIEADIDDLYESARFLWRVINERLLSEGGAIGTLDLINETLDSLTAGQLIGYSDDTGVMSLAVAASGSSYTRAIAAVTVTVAPFEAFTPKVSGVHRIRTEDGTLESDIVAGQIAYLSTSDSGTVTPTRPVSGRRQVVGIFVNLPPNEFLDDFTAPVMLMLDHQMTRI